MSMLPEITELVKHSGLPTAVLQEYFDEHYPCLKRFQITQYMVRQ